MQTVKNVQEGKVPQLAGRGKQDASLCKGAGMRFAISLLGVLLAVYAALEWKSYVPTGEWGISMDVDDLPDQPVPVTKIELKSPPPPATPEVIYTAPDDAKVIETILTSTETSQEDAILQVSDIDVVKMDPEDIVPFAVIEEVPVFPGCEGAADKRACFNEKMQEHIRKNFRYPEVARKMGVQGRVSLVFTIQKDGSIGNIRMRGPDRSLEAEAQRIIGKLPEMTPGKQQGRPVRVSFSLPIQFRLQ